MASPVPPKLAAKLTNGIPQSFDTGLYSDLRIVTPAGDEYAVHRLVVCIQSTFFASACQPDHSSKETQISVIHLQHPDAAAIKAMLDFMYRGTYTHPNAPLSSKLFAARVHAVADRHGVAELRDLAAADFDRAGGNAFDFDATDFVGALKFIYESTVPLSNGGGDGGEGNAVLRQKAVKLAHLKIRCLMEKPEFLALLDGNGALGKDLLCATLTPGSGFSGGGGGGDASGGSVKQEPAGSPRATSMPTPTPLSVNNPFAVSGTPSPANLFGTLRAPPSFGSPSQLPQPFSRN